MSARAFGTKGIPSVELLRQGAIAEAEFAAIQARSVAETVNWQYWREVEANARAAAEFWGKAR